MSRDFSVIGRALATPARSTILDLLMDGSARPAGELAKIAGVSASAASEHLAVLLDAGLLRYEVRGRQRFYRIATSTIAAALEHIGRLCPELPVRSLRQSRQQRDLAEARLCYDHLAGRLAVALADGYVAARWLEAENMALTPRGEGGFTELGVDVVALRAGRRPLTRPCPDWTERRPHLAGSLGAAVAALFQQRGWAQRGTSGRGLTLTAIGAAALTERFDIPLAT